MPDTNPPAAAPLPAGTQAPDFTLHSAPDLTVSLSDYRGQPVILAFYPADWSPVCGDQMALYNEIRSEFEGYGARLLGISVDGAWCHRAFADQRKLHFPLLADFEPKGPWRGATACTARATGSASERCSSSTVTGSSAGATSRPSGSTPAPTASCVPSTRSPASGPQRDQARRGHSIDPAGGRAGPHPGPSRCGRYTGRVRRLRVPALRARVPHHQGDPATDGTETTVRVPQLPAARESPPR